MEGEVGVMPDGFVEVSAGTNPGTVWVEIYNERWVEISADEARELARKLIEIADANSACASVTQSTQWKPRLFASLHVVITNHG